MHLTQSGCTANDHPGRDPYLLDVFGCHHGMSDKVKSGCRRLGNDSVTVEKADKPYAEVSAHFTNDKSFSYYKVMITAIRNRSKIRFNLQRYGAVGLGNLALEVTSATEKTSSR